MGAGDELEKWKDNVENAIKKHKDATIAIIVIISIIVISAIVIAVLVWWNPFSSSTTDDTTTTTLLTAEEEASILKSVAKKMVGTRKYYQLYPIANKYLDSDSSNSTHDITSGKPTVVNKGNCFYSDNEKFAVHIDENSYILLLKAVNKAAGVWEVSKVLYDGDSSNTFSEPYSLVIDTSGSFNADSKTDFTLKGSVVTPIVKAFHPLLTFGVVNASNYRLYIDESSGKVRVRVYGSSFSLFAPSNDVEVVAF